MRLYGPMLAAILVASCTTGEKDTDPVDDSDVVDTDPVIETDTDDSDPVIDTDPVETDVDTDDDTDLTNDSNDTQAVDSFNPDTTTPPDPPDTVDTFGGGGGETGGDPGPCDPFEVQDCDGECFNQLLLGDGVCHDGVQAGTPNFDCLEYNYDDGDCLGDTDDGPCPDPLDVRDCNSKCWPLAWVGDGSCDDGTVYPHGDPDFACLLFAYDDGDCPTP